MRKAVVLLSGGLDSATTLYIAKSRSYKTHCLIFDYGQRHRKEVRAARHIARAAGSPFKVIKIRLPWRGSSLLDRRRPIPVRRGNLALKRGIPSTYVPARNTIFLSFALSYAEAIGAGSIFIGANSLDYSGYPDCRPNYFQTFNRLSFLATRTGVEGKGIRIQTPLIRLKKSQIIRRGVRLGVPLRLTWSCYKGAGRPCRSCDSCRLREKGFREAGRQDPLLKS